MPPTLTGELILIVAQCILGLLGWFAVQWVRAELRSLKEADMALASRIATELVGQRSVCAEHAARTRVLEDGANERRVRIATLEAHHVDFNRRLDQIDGKLDELLTYQRNGHSDGGR